MRIVGLYPGLLGSKISVFRSGCRRILPTILLAVATLPAFCQSAAFRTASPSPELAPGTIVEIVAAEKSAVQASGDISYSIVANGKSSGVAFELQVIDKSGKIKRLAMPEGVVLEPMKRPEGKPMIAKAAQDLLTKQLTAFCLERGKLPPDPGMLYRIAPQAVQDRYKFVRPVLQAGRELAAAGKFHPDSDPGEYANDIRQYSLWARLENWNEQQFTEKFLEHTRKNADAKNVKWTTQLEQAVVSLAPGRWRDVSMVLQEAQRLSQQSSPNGEQ